jgi:predicted transcriptional regulator
MRRTIMGESTFTFRVDEDLKSAFAEMAKSRDRTGAQLLRDFMRDEVKRQSDAADHDAWFRREVEQAVREADDPTEPRIAHAEARADWLEQRAELVKLAARK